MQANCFRVYRNRVACIVIPAPDEAVRSSQNVHLRTKHSQCDSSLNFSAEILWQYSRIDISTKFRQLESLRNINFSENWSLLGRKNS